MRERSGGFEGKVIIVTGSSRGIGYETAALFLRRGGLVVLNARHKEPLEAARESLDPAGEKSLAVAGDMRDPEDVTRLIVGAVEKFGGIDVLVCNAGLMMRGSFSDLSPGVVDSIIGVNIVGVALPIIEALPEITKRKGSIEIISSLAGVRGMPHISLYCASKMALTAIAEALWVELAGTGIHVGILYVGITENSPDKYLVSGDGSPIQVSGSYHSTKQDVARMIYKQVRRRRRRIVMTPAGKALVFAQWLFPRLLTFLISRASKTAANFAK